MVQKLLDNSVWLIGLSTFVYLFVSMVRRDMKRRNIGLLHYLNLILERSKMTADSFVLTTVSTLVLSFLISLVACKELWNTDVFNIIFVTSFVRPGIDLFVNQVMKPTSLT